MFTSTRRLYLNRDKTGVVEEGDPEAAFLLVAEGGELPHEEAEKYGLTTKAAPAETKAVKPRADKGR